jgi:4-amino-4-deoxy-L-arabinose transferase-like glycosyltransferase
MKWINQSRLHLFFLIVILLIAFIVRVYALDKNPYGFFCDEAAIGYNAYSILTTGNDEYGIPHPVFFRSFGEYKSPIAIYATVPFIQLFGLNEFSIRLQSVIFGLITLVMVYLITRNLFSKNAALASATVAATMPWLIHYNRTGFEMNSYIAFFTATIFLLLKAIKQKAYIIPAFVVGALTLYTYYSAKLIVPLFIIGFLIIFGKKLFVHRKEMAISALVFLTLSIPFIISFANGEGTARFNEVSIFTAKLSSSEMALRIINNYLLQLSPSLFLNGEPTFITRHFTGGLTPLLLVTIPFLYVGIISLFITWKKKSSQLLLLWLILYPIGAAVVADPPFTGRTIIGAPLSAILIALGIMSTIRFVKKYAPPKILLSFITIAIGLNFVFFLQFYFIKYPLYSADFWGWQSGPAEIVTYFESQKQNYDDMYLIGEFNAPYIFFKFYAPHGCEKCKLGVPDLNYDLNKKQLFAVSPAYLATHSELRFAIKKIIYYPNRKEAFLIGEVQR